MGPGTLPRIASWLLGAESPGQLWTFGESEDLRCSPSNVTLCLSFSICKGERSVLNL